MKKRGKRIKKKKWKPSPETCMTKEEATQMFKAAESRKIQNTKAAIKDWLIIHFGFHTGLRASEMAALDCRHIELHNLENPNVFIEKGKTIQIGRAHV